MIKVNGIEIKPKYFPDGTLNLNGVITKDMRSYQSCNITWNFENNEELLILYFISRYVNKFSVEKTLYMPYIPNARMDRCKNEDDVFTLKYFSELINSMEFDSVCVLDPHSTVSEALINNIRTYNLRDIVSIIDQHLPSDVGKVVVCFPDSGAYKRYEDLFKGCEICYSIKHRNWEDGKITGLEMVTNGIDLKGRNVVIHDDLISYGGSIYFVAKKLKELGVNRIFAYASHTEDSILDKEKGTLIKLLEDGTVEKLFTTNSLFTGKHEKIYVIEL